MVCEKRVEKLMKKTMALLVGELRKALLLESDLFGMKLYLFDCRNIIKNSSRIKFFVAIA
jgi:hypothetical protein